MNLDYVSLRVYEIPVMDKALWPTVLCSLIFGSFLFEAHGDCTSDTTNFLHLGRIMWLWGNDILEVTGVTSELRYLNAEEIISSLLCLLILDIMEVASCHLSDTGWFISNEAERWPNTVSEDRLEFGLYPGGMQYSAGIFDYIVCSKQCASDNRK